MKGKRAIARELHRRAVNTAYARRHATLYPSPCCGKESKREPNHSENSNRYRCPCGQVWEAR